MRIILIIIALFIVSECYGQTVWITKNDAAINKDVGFESDIYKLLNESRYYKTFKFTDDMENKSINDNDYLIYFFYSISSAGELYGYYTMFRAKKTESNIEFIFTYRRNIFLYTSDNYLNLVLSSKNLIIDWCKELNIIIE